MWNDATTVAAAEGPTVNLTGNLGAAIPSNLHSSHVASAYQQGGSLPSGFFALAVLIESWGQWAHLIGWA